MSEVISLEELRNQRTEVIEISPFTGENSINVRVKRPSILGLCQDGVIPNQLLGVARKLFYQEDIKNVALKEYGEVINIICKNTLVEPSIDQLKEAGLQLTDQQRFELWAYSQQGVEGLKSFRKVTKSAVNNSDGQDLQNKAQQDTEHK